MSQWTSLAETKVHQRNSSCSVSAYTDTKAKKNEQNNRAANIKINDRIVNKSSANANRNAQQLRCMFETQ